MDIILLCCILLVGFDIQSNCTLAVHLVAGVIVCQANVR